MVGRLTERKELERLYNSPKSEFVAIYGRRRIGKTYLVKEHFKGRLTFWHTGMSLYDRDKTNIMQDQLTAFYTNLVRYGLEECPVPKSWFEAFTMLSRLIENVNTDSKKVIFIDEMPWMDTARSRFIPALENFWNDWAAKRDDILLIVCGSATSWIEDNLIRAKGGLYGRLTDTIHLEPFTLSECKSFFEENGVLLSGYDIAEAYMAFGGVPYYLGFFKGELSLVQNVDNLLFSKGAKLEDEFDILFGSLFVNPEQYKSIVRLLSSRRVGFTREEIAQETGIGNGGGLTTQLKALISNNFIDGYTPFWESKRKIVYRLSDSFCKFYLKFVDGKHITDQHFWTNNIKSPAVSAWKGIAFEDLCLIHIQQIKRALGIEGVSSSESSLQIKGDGEREGTQIDLVIDRADNVVNLCEMKFYNDDFSVTKEYYRKLNHRMNAVQRLLPKRKTVRLTLVTSFGLARNEYSGIFQNVVTLEDLMG